MYHFESFGESQSSSTNNAESITFPLTEITDSHIVAIFAVQITKHTASIHTQIYVCETIIALHNGDQILDRDGKFKVLEHKFLGAKQTRLMKGQFYGYVLIAPDCKRFLQGH